MTECTTILVVDDDPRTRETAVSLFEALGFEVLDTYSGADALSLLSRHPDIEVLFTDVRMPGMSGTELAQKARRVRPDLHVVLTSGYPGEAPLPDIPFVPK